VSVHFHSTSHLHITASNILMSVISNTAHANTTANLLTGRHAVQFRRVAFNCTEVMYRFQVRFRMVIQTYFDLHSMKQTMTK